MSSIVSRLIYKDFYLHRGLMGMAFVAGALALAVSGINVISFTIGSILYVTAMVALGIMLVMYGVVQERKDKVLLFVLSLPISPGQYLRAKVLAALSTFLLPWGVLTLGGVVAILVSRAPEGMIPSFLLLAGFMLMNFCIILAGALITTSEGAITFTVIVTNVSISFFFMLLANIPSIVANSKQDAIRWDTPCLVILAAEVVITFAALALPIYIRRRRSLI